MIPFTTLYRFRFNSYYERYGPGCPDGPFFYVMWHAEFKSLSYFSQPRRRRFLMGPKGLLPVTVWQPKVPE